MYYEFIRDGVAEKVALERWQWGVIYKDGSELHQFTADGKFHQFQEINQSEVAMFCMFNEDRSKRIDMPMNEGMQIFHFYRDLIIAGGSPDERRVKVYVFGWKRDKVTSYNYILPDDRMIVADRDISGLQDYGI